MPAWVRAHLSAGDATSATSNEGLLIPDHLPFWFKPISIFGLSPLTTVTMIHLRCPYHAILVPDRRMLAVTTFTRVPVATCQVRITLSRELHTPPLPVTHVSVGYQ